MVFPLMVLSVPAIISGFVNPPPFLSFLGIPAHWLSDFLKTPQVAAALGEHEAAAFNPMLAGISVALGGLGIFLAYAIYSARWLSAEAIGKAFAPIYRMLINKYWIDYLYEQLLVMNFLIRSLFYAVQWFDTYIVDGAVNGTAWVATSLGGTLRRMQTGQPQVYGLAIVVGVLAMLIALLIYRPVM
ncbi:MAG: hypothetical protein Q8O76_13150 [Chloroflexota bacterium]|nr:hypothetical protein [Chloroflexota bacterium]